MLKQVFDVLSECDWFEESVGEQSEDADVILFLRQQAGACVRLLCKELGLSQEGAIYEVRKFLKLEPLRYCQSPISRSSGGAAATFASSPPLAHMRPQPS